MASVIRARCCEIAAAESPDAYLQSLHPKHEQFQRLREALLKARSSGDAGGKPAGVSSQRRRGTGVK